MTGLKEGSLAKWLNVNSLPNTRFSMLPGVEIGAARK